MKRLIIFPLALLAVFFLSCNEKDNSPSWQLLFNGTDLSNWTQVSGSAPFEVKDSIIIGTTVTGSPNSFLVTKVEYSDFIMELEFKAENGMNSGIQIRSHSLPSYQDGRVHGYQVEIDVTPRAYTGGIYDEGRRGWLYALSEQENEEARQAYLQEEWNSMRIEAIGNQIKTWLNGIPVSNIYDDTDASGFIALQVHSVGSDTSMGGKKIMWKNIRILTKNPQKYRLASGASPRSYLVNQLISEESEQGWKLLFDGSTSAGWRKAYSNAFPDKGWKIENGILTVLPSTGEESNNGGDIVTLDKFSNFELKLQVKLTPGANSGIKYFVAEEEINHVGSAIGLEYQILDDNLHPDAKLGNHEGSRTFSSLYDLISATGKRVNAIGEWNNVRIIADGAHVEHWLNGFKVLEFERGSEAFRKLVSESKYKERTGFGEAEAGHILLQDHGNEVSFRSIKIREIKQGTSTNE